MENIITYFDEKSIKNIAKKLNDALESFLGSPETLPDYLMAVHEGVLELGRLLVSTTLTAMDEEITALPGRRSRWMVKDRRDRHLTTSLGDVQFRHTIFEAKDGTGCRCLLDEVLGLDAGQRITEDALAKILEEAASTSYRRGGECINQHDPVTKQTVMDKIRDLRFPPEPTVGEKRKVPRLYIEADEDHVALQHRGRKGGPAGEGPGHNRAIAKLVYIYEGLEKNSPGGKRRHLVNAHYIAGAYPGSENRELWEEVRRYVEATYDLDSLEAVFLSSDGGAWIKGALGAFPGVRVILDGFHLSQYITRITTFMGDSAYDAAQELRAAIRGDSRDAFGRVVGRISALCDKETGRQRITESAGYILDNWDAAVRRLRRDDGVVGCSAEGHVSHVLSARMSSRPMGWSQEGMDKMCHLRAYFNNGGDAYRLAKYQKLSRAESAGELSAETLPKAAGIEGLSCTQVLRSERNNHPLLGKYVEAIQACVSPIISNQNWYRGMMKIF